MRNRSEVACHLCFSDKALQAWIREERIGRGICPWCGRRGHLIHLTKLAEPFREVVSIYDPVEGPDAIERGEPISSCLDDEWQVFSERLQISDLAQQLAVAILHSDLDGKERLDYPNFGGFF